jgi:hypothetical protein
VIGCAEVRTGPQVDDRDFFGSNPELLHNLALSEFGNGNNVIGFPPSVSLISRPRLAGEGRQVQEVVSV